MEREGEESEEVEKVKEEEEKRGGEGLSEAVEEKGK